MEHAESAAKLWKIIKYANDLAKNGEKSCSTFLTPIFPWYFQSPKPRFWVPAPSLLLMPFQKKKVANYFETSSDFPSNKKVFCGEMFSHFLLYKKIIIWLKIPIVHYIFAKKFIFFNNKAILVAIFYNEKFCEREKYEKQHKCNFVT